VVILKLPKSSETLCGEKIGGQEGNHRGVSTIRGEKKRERTQRGKKLSDPNIYKQKQRGKKREGDNSVSTSKFEGLT